MIIAKSKKELLSAIQDKKTTFVPTLGGLHKAHLSLFKLAKDQNFTEERNTLVASIFLNPLQFNSKEDYVNYPASTEDDIKLAKENGVEILFLPHLQEIYPGEESSNIDGGINQTTIKAPKLSKYLCGKSRPGHFDGVLTVVNILFNIIGPSKAIFGEKDFQQLRLIENMVEDLHLKVDILRAPLIREDSGLAFSSRNKKLSEKAKNEAASIFKALTSLSDIYKNLEDKEKTLGLIEKAKEKLSSELELDYFEIREEKNLTEIIEAPQKAEKLRAFIAAKIEGVRLIDNMALRK